MLMTIFDTDRSGTISYSGACVFLMLVNFSSIHGWSFSIEFAGLWKYLADWQNVFRHFDQDRSGSIEGHELASALQNFGYALSPRLISLVEQKYSSQPATAVGYGPSPGITFDRFVRACVAIKSLSEAFQRFDSDRDGWIQISYEQFMNLVLSAPWVLESLTWESVLGPASKFSNSNMSYCNTM